MLCSLGAPKLFADSSCAFKVCVLEASGLAAFANVETLVNKTEFLFFKSSQSSKERDIKPAIATVNNMQGRFSQNSTEECPLRLGLGHQSTDF